MTGVPTRQGRSPRSAGRLSTAGHCGRLPPRLVGRRLSGSVPGRRIATTIVHRFNAFDHFPVAMTCISLSSLSNEAGMGNRRARAVSPRLTPSHEAGCTIPCTVVDVRVQVAQLRVAPPGVDRQVARDGDGRRQPPRGMSVNADRRRGAAPPVTAAMTVAKSGEDRLLRRDVRAAGAAVHEEGRAVDVRRLVGSKVERGRGDFFGFSESPHR